jgi:hypothetical protein
MAVVEPRHRSLVGRLQLVVELVDDALADLVPDRLGVELGGDRPGEPEQHPEVLHVGADRVVDAGVLDLDGDVAAVLQRGAVDLADRGRRDRLGIELGEGVCERAVEVGLDHLAHLLEADRRSGIAERGELRLEALAVLWRDHPDVDEGEHLADLHRGPLHPPEDGDDLLGGLELPPLHRGARALVGAGDVGGSGARLLDGLAGRGRADPGEPADPPGGESVGHRARPPGPSGP